MLKLQLSINPSTFAPVIALVDGSTVLHEVFTVEVGLDIVGGDPMLDDKISDVLDAIGSDDKYSDQERTFIRTATINGDIDMTPLLPTSTKSE